MGTTERDIYLVITTIILFFILLVAVFLYMLYQKQKRLMALEQRTATSALMKTEKDRYDIATILHNELVPYLAGIKLRLGRIQNVHPDITEDCLPALETSIETIRGLTKKMAPMGMYDESFMKGIEQYIHQTGIHRSLRVDIQDHEGYSLDQEKNMLLYRLLQEVVLNTFKHSRATALKIEASIERGDLLIRTADNGTGFFWDADAIRTGFGLKMIQTIVDGLGGTLSKSGMEISGTRYNFRLPYNHES